MTFRCLYCEQEWPDSENSEEHIIPESMGGTLVMNDVCRRCNGQLGTQVDAPLVGAPWIRGQRHLLGIENKKGEIPALDFGDGTLAQDPDVGVRFIVDAKGQRMKIWGKKEEAGVTTLFMDADRFLETDMTKLLARFAKQGKEKVRIGIYSYQDPSRGKEEVEAVRMKLDSIRGLAEPIEHGEVQPQVNTHFKFDLYSFHRAIVKIAYEFAISVLGRAYSESEEGQRLKSFVLEEDVEKRKAIPIRGAIFPNVPVIPLFDSVLKLKDYEHIVMLHDFACTVILFGKLYGNVQVLEPSAENAMRFSVAGSEGLVIVTDVRDSKTAKSNYMAFVGGRLQGPS